MPFIVGRQLVPGKESYCFPGAVFFFFFNKAQPQTIKSGGVEGVVIEGPQVILICSQA